MAPWFELMADDSIEREAKPTGVGWQWLILSVCVSAMFSAKTTHQILESLLFLLKSNRCPFGGMLFLTYEIRILNGGKEFGIEWKWQEQFLWLEKLNLDKFSVQKKVQNLEFNRIFQPWCGSNHGGVEQRAAIVGSGVSSSQKTNLSFRTKNYCVNWYKFYVRTRKTRWSLIVR